MEYSRVLICGGRNYSDEQKFASVIESLQISFSDDFCIIQGGATGADALAKRYFLEKGKPVIEMQAPWKSFGKGAGPIRNAWMIRYCNPDLVIAFPGGAGTDCMIGMAERAGIPVFEVAV